MSACSPPLFSPSPRVHSHHAAAQNAEVARTAGRKCDGGRAHERRHRLLLPLVRNCRMQARSLTLHDVHSTLQATDHLRGRVLHYASLTPVHSGAKSPTRSSVIPPLYISHESAITACLQPINKPHCSRLTGRISTYANPIILSCHV